MTDIINNFKKFSIVFDNKNTEEYYSNYIPEKVNEIITEKMYYIVKHPDNTTVYKTPEECDKLLYELSTKITSKNYDNILSKLLKQYNSYSFEFYICYNLDIVSIMFRILTKEYYKFIKYYMKHNVAKHEYDNESEEMILNKLNSYKKKEERKKYKNLKITIPIYIPPYRYI
jgi:hypothetical protein